MPLILVGDIGGTNSRLSVFKVAGASGAAGRTSLQGQEFVHQATFKNEQFVKFTDIVAAFFAECHASGIDHGAIVSASLAVAGPVTNNQVRLTNKSFVICGHELETFFGIKRVTLINDFVANGYGLLTLEEQDLVTVQGNAPVAGDPIACVGAGTGLGEVFLTSTNGVYDAFPSEGGHVEFAPRNPLELEMFEFLQKLFQGRISVERVVSGKGIVNIYTFLRHKFPEDVVPAHDKRIMESEEGAAVIAALLYDDKLCRKTIEVFISAYGSEVGNVALKFLPRGGLYIAGGIAPKLLELIAPPGGHLFVEAMCDKGRMRELVAQIPVHVVTVTDLGMRGARVVAARSVHEASAKAVAAKASGAEAAPTGQDFHGSFDATLAFGLGLGALVGGFAARAIFRK